jgi:hypothetical protein
MCCTHSEQFTHSKHRLSGGTKLETEKLNCNGLYTTLTAAHWKLKYPIVVAVVHCYTHTFTFRKRTKARMGGDGGDRKVMPKNLAVCSIMCVVVAKVG